jgi:arylsulfatase A
MAGDRTTMLHMRYVSTCLGPAAFVLAGLVGAAGAAAADGREVMTRPPNIVFILVDDLGWSELGSYGNRFNDTPNVDRLADAGLRFTSAYAAAPVCSPTRAALATGQYPARVGITDYLRGNDRKYLSPAYYTLAEALRDGGYVTGLIGKWHLMGDYARRKGDPALHGFDEVICSETRYIADGDYFAPYRFMPDVKPLHEGEYLTDRLDEEAVAFIQRHKDRPFFLYLSHYAVHAVLAGKPDLESRFRGKPGAGQRGRKAELAAMLVSVDEGVGRIVHTLEALGLKDRTLIVFTSDNGGDRAVTSNAPLRAGKATLYEGGIRVPLIVCGAGVGRSGVCHTPVSTIDFYPTFLELAGLRPRPGQILDGESLRPLLQRDVALHRDTLFWHFPLEEPLKRRPASAVRRGGLKLIEFHDTHQRELYDLDKDPCEADNLVKSRPREAAELARVLDRWRNDVERQGPATQPGEPRAGRPAAAR